MNVLHTDISDAQALFKKIADAIDMTGKELAEIIGSSERSIRRWRNGNDSTAGSIKLSDFLKLCEKTGITIRLEKDGKML